MAFEFPPLNFHELGVGGEKWVLAAVTLGGIAVGMYASGSESERAGFVFLLCFHRSFLMNWVSEGEGRPAFSILSGGAFGMHASELRERVRGIFCFLRFPRSIFTDWMGGKKGVLASFTLNGDVLGMHSRGSRAVSASDGLFRAFGRSIFQDQGRGLGNSVDIYPRLWCFWVCIPVRGKSERTKYAFVLRSCRVFSRTEWRGERVPVFLYF